MATSVLHRPSRSGRASARTGLSTGPNTIEGYFPILKRGIYGVYQHVSEAHLHRYLSEFDFRYSHRIKLGVNDKQRADLALLGAKSKRSTYETTCSQRAAEAIPFCTATLARCAGRVIHS